MTEYSIEIQPDFLQRQAKAQPVAAVVDPRRQPSRVGMAPS